MNENDRIMDDDRRSASETIQEMTSALREAIADRERRKGVNDPTARRWREIVGPSEGEIAQRAALAGSGGSMTKPTHTLTRREDSLVRDVMSLREQNDALVEALRGCVDDLQATLRAVGMTRSSTIDTARAALAKAEEA